MDACETVMNTETKRQKGQGERGGRETTQVSGHVHFYPYILFFHEPREQATRSNEETKGKEIETLNLKAEAIRETEERGEERSDKQTSTERRRTDNATETHTTQRQVAKQTDR